MHLILAIVAATGGGAAHANTLQKIKATGSVTMGVRESSIPAGEPAESVSVLAGAFTINGRKAR